MQKHSRHHGTDRGKTSRRGTATAGAGCPVYSVGHSNQTMADLIQLLQSRSIQLLVDCRSTPYSSHNPQFNREELEPAMAEAGIKYLYAGHELGGQPKHHPAGYPGVPDYDQIAKRPAFRRGIARLAVAADREAVCLLCSEEDPRRCHRSHLLARELLAAGIDVRHIRRDGGEELQSELDREAARHRQLLLFVPTGGEGSDA